ncbi:MAG TPA: SLBB domain-containing protein [Nevskia sp.]|nr:SLBB domain-containing protein [Nevskia sp.]
MDQIRLCRRRGAAWCRLAGALCAALLGVGTALAQDDSVASINSSSGMRLEPSLSMDEALPPPQVADAPASPPATPSDAADPVIKLGPGDAVAVQVYGRPEMSTTTYVADNGSISVPLAGAVQVGGLSPAEAGEAVAKALRDGQYLLRPQVTVTLSQFRSQQISVLGEVKTPGRYPLESRTSVIDLLAQAGGETENGADVIYVLRPHPGGGTDRFPIDLKSLRQGPLPTMALKGGDSVYVPRADRFYIYGEVQAPNAYRLEPGMTVIQALSRSGGVTARGSEHRIVITRQTPDGGHVAFDAKPFDQVQADDVIRVKERIF